MATNKKIDDYLKLPWTYKLKEEIEKKKTYYIASIDEMPGVCSDGETVEEAINSVKEALHAALELSLELGKDISLPVDKDKYKGKVAYRTSPSRHYKLAIEANRRHVSLSKLLDIAVDNVVTH